MSRSDQPTSYLFANIVGGRLTWCTFDLYRADGAVSVDRKEDSDFSSSCLSFQNVRVEIDPRQTTDSKQS